MEDSCLARPWADVHSLLAAEHSLYVCKETRSPRTFFAVDEAAPYVVRVRGGDGDPVFTLTPAPARSPSVAAYEEKSRERVRPLPAIVGGVFW